MASNYYYIVAGLPELLLDFENKPFDFFRLKEDIRNMVDGRDRRLIDWLLFGGDAHRLSTHFYRVVSLLKNDFLRNYYGFDLQLRNVLAAVSARTAGVNPAPHLIGKNELTDALSHSKASDFGLKDQAEWFSFLLSILEELNLLEREQKIDRLRWEQANAISANHYFTMDVILCFLLKASILNRWMVLDKVEGQQLFKKLVKEITDNRNTTQS